jgi:hypothetical protein
MGRMSDSAETESDTAGAEDNLFESIAGDLEKPDAEGKTLGSQVTSRPQDADRAAQGIRDEDDREEAVSDDPDTDPGTAGTDDDTGLLEDPAEPATASPAAKGKAVEVPDDAVLFTVDYPDGTSEAVTKKEARRHILREKDYTQKTMALAEVKKAALAEKEAYAGLVQAYKTHLDKIKEPDWEAIKAADPQQYLIARDEWRAVQDEQAAVAAEQKRLNDERAAEQDTLTRQQVAEETQKLLQALPHWKDQKVAAKEVALIQSHLESRGFGADFLGRLTAKEALLVRDAVLYHQLKSKAKSKIAPPASKPLRPGTTATKAPASKAQTRFKETGKLRDAGDAFAEEIFG